MANKKINELDSRSSLSLSDLMAVGDPSTGYLYKTTISDLKTLTGAGVISFNGRFGAVSPAEGDYSLTQLSDVIITSASNGQLLQYNGSNWVNATLDLSGYVPYTGATANVNLGTYDLTADVITGATGSFASSGGSNTFAINHSSGSGIALNITKGGNGEGLYINKTDGSGNAATIIGTLNATTLVKNGGTSSQFLKADGSVDSSTYVTTDTNQTISGVKIFSSIIYANGTVYLPAAGTASQTKLENISTVGVVNFGANSLGFNSNDNLHISSNSKGYAVFAFNNAGTGHTYTLPATTGTIALTSNIPSLTNYVTLDGTQTITGDKTYSGVNIYDGYQTRFSMGIAINNTTSGGAVGSHTVIGANVNGLQINLAGGGYNNLNFASTSAGNTYTLPNATGTIALTSDLSAYLPLSGGTLTGALNINTGSGTGLNVASDLVVFRANTGFGSPRQITLFAGNGATTYLEAKGYGANYITDFGIRTYNASGTAFDVFFGTSAGNVGIGTTAPMSKLEVNDSNGIPIRFGDISSAISGQTAGYIGMSTSAFSGNNGDLVLYPRTSATSRILLMGGNVGIGTATPQSYSGYTILSINSETNSGLLAINKNGSSYLNIYTDGTSGIIDGASGASIKFVTNDTERMRITTSGNVGIGTSSPSKTLQVDSGSAASGGQVWSHSNGTIYARLSVVNPGVSNNTEFGTQSNNDLQLMTANVERMRITNDGRFLVGATETNSGCKARIVYDGINQNGLQLFDSTNNTSSTLFHLFGINNPTPINIGSITRVSNTNAVSFNTTSDYRLKEDYKEINGLDKVLSIKVYDFKWKGLESRMDGVIAHELQDVLPYAVYGEKDGLDKQGIESYQMVDYSKIVPILVKAIQEQQAQIEELKALINK